MLSTGNIMPWLQLTIPTTRAIAPRIEQILINSDVLSITYEDNGDEAILEPELGEHALWSMVNITGLFDVKVNTKLISNTLNQESQISETEHTWKLLEDKDWERESLKNYLPIKCSKRLWVCPSWIEPPEPDSINLLLDPGLAFGTGTHSTTFLCLKWLDTLKLEGKTVIDYGCGSGILAIASLLLGAKNTTCIDIDPQALIATLDNANRNGLLPHLTSVYLPENSPNNSADILIANILAGPLISLASHLATLTNPGGFICLSGIMKDQAEEVRREFSTWFDFDPPVYRKEWVRLTAKKRSFIYL